MNDLQIEISVISSKRNQYSDKRPFKTKPDSDIQNIVTIS